MTSPKLADGLSDLAAGYDVLLCDVWGVIHNGREAFPAACAALVRYRAERGPVVLISNSPRTYPEVVKQLSELGVPEAAYSAVATSGDVTRVLLGERAPGPFWRLGPERDGPLYAGLGLEFGPVETARYIACTGPFDDDTETPEDYRVRFETLVAQGAEMVCANPDIVVQRGDKLIYCGGALAQLYEALGGKVAMAGKPHRPLYDLALKLAGEQLGQAADRARVLCIGDGLGTDIRGANAQGLDVLFIASGIHGAETAPGGRLEAGAVADLLGEQGLTATWAMADLVW